MLIHADNPHWNACVMMLLHQKPFLCLDLHPRSLLLLQYPCYLQKKCYIVLIKQVSYINVTIFVTACYGTNSQICIPCYCEMCLNNWGKGLEDKNIEPII